MTSSVDLDLNWLLCVVSLTYSPLSLFLPLSLSLSLSLFEKRRWYSLRHARGPQCLNHFSCTLLKYCLKPEMKVFVPLQLSLVLQINLTGIMVISSSQEGKVSQSIATECLFVFRAALRHYTRRLQVEPLYGSFWSVHSASRHQAIAYFSFYILKQRLGQYFLSSRALTHTEPKLATCISICCTGSGRRSDLGLFQHLHQFRCYCGCIHLSCQPLNQLLILRILLKHPIGSKIQLTESQDIT